MTGAVYAKLVERSILRFAHLPCLPRMADKAPPLESKVIKMLRNGIVIIRHALTESQNWRTIELVILKLKNPRFFSKFLPKPTNAEYTLD